MTVEMIAKSALLSPCGTYRYWLSRVWDESLPACAFIMLNPSTADAEKDDPTIRRCIGFAESWGYGALNVYNLFALRSTKPQVLYAHSDPVGPDNDAHLSQIPESACVVAAWGNHGDFRSRSFSVRRMFKGRLKNLGLSLQGQPLHPLYLPAYLKPQEYPFK